jgi:hypothetical protein
MELLVQPLEMIVGIILVAAMAVEAGELLLHAKLAGMREVFVIIGMAVEAGEIPVVTLVIERRIDDEIRVHPILDGPFGNLIIIIVGSLTMAFETLLVLFGIFKHAFLVLSRNGQC